MAWPETYARRADAVKVLAELERQSQVAGNWLDVAGSKVLFAAYADEWINQHPRLGPRTADVYRSLIRRHLAPALGQIPLGQLDTATVRAWRAGLLEVGVSSTMVAKSYRLLRAILNTAVTEDELIIVNPCRIKGAGEERATERPVLTLASLRWGEITALTPTDLDLERRTVRIRRQFLTMPRGLQLGPRKSRAGIRMVSFPAAILSELQHHLDTYSLNGPDGWVFVNEHGQPWHRGNFNRAVRWREAREQIGLPNLHLHDLRHTGNTLAAQSGASLRDLMTRMGHDSPAAAVIYQHSSRVADEAIAAALDARLTERKSRPAPNVVGPVEGPTEPQLIAVVATPFGKMASDQG